MSNLRTEWEQIQARDKKNISELRQEVDQQWAWERRREYLEDYSIFPLVYHALGLIALQEINIASGNVAGAIWFAERALKATKQINTHVKELHYTRPDMKTKGITDTMIEQAKNYPFEELYPFKRGMALCPFHPDSKPSMSLKNNRVRCWSCMDKSMDTIEFKMKLDDVSFSEAVKALQ